MNFIAHIQLSGTKEQLMVGNYIADILRPRDVQLLNDRIAKGVALHRHIDTFTDAHPINKKIIQLLRPAHRRYAPVLLDIFYDYFLIRHWFQFEERSFPSVCDWTYSCLEKYSMELPPAVRPYIANLLNKKWLIHAYSDDVGLERTFYFLKKRTSRPEWVDHGITTLHQFEKELETAFLLFYPALEQSVRDWKLENLS